MYHLYIKQKRFAKINIAFSSELTDFFPNLKEMPNIGRDFKLPNIKICNWAKNLISV